VRLTSARDRVDGLNVYRPGSEKPSAQLFDELTAVLETLVINACPIVVGGDFSVYVSIDLGCPSTTQVTSRTVGTIS